jgi:hypothetical protein
MEMDIVMLNIFKIIIIIIIILSSIIFMFL